MLKRIIFGGTIASLLTLSAFAVDMNNNGGGMGCDKPMMGKHAKGGMQRGGMSSLSAVNLTAEQKTKIDAINEEFRTEMAKLHIKAKGMKDPFVVAGGFNKEAFKKERLDMMQKHLDAEAEKFAKIWAVLTPEQQKTLMSLAK